MDDYLVVGTIGATHALKGEVKILSTTDFAEKRYQKGNTLYVKKDETMIPVVVKTHRKHKNYDLVSFENYDDIDLVSPFVKCKIYVSMEQLDELDEGEYYHYELIDCHVYSDTRLIGKVVNMVNYGASDILIVVDENNKEIMIPFVDEFLEDVDIENKKIVIKEIEGLIT